MLASYQAANSNHPYTVHQSFHSQCALWWEIRELHNDGNEIEGKPLVCIPSDHPQTFNIEASIIPSRKFSNNRPKNPSMLSSAIRFGWRIHELHKEWNESRKKATVCILSDYRVFSTTSVWMNSIFERNKSKLIMPALHRESRQKFTLLLRLPPSTTSLQMVIPFVFFPRKDQGIKFEIKPWKHSDLLKKF